ncbi:MAG: tRNA (N(6)-L-threonylcarbamoyladenosine(37)-C(2))-methylthiotransferase MtaB [Eubacterium sp.]|nr:tRNA (N(6)-L-threonylcarbamoyladenosine(37)-C(2))-methylthiotransferase MtaB [Eubacterium sp.]
MFLENPRKAALLTLGCKVNQYETDAMQELLEKAGYEIVDFRDRADVYIINTCSVTNMADRKSRQMIHRARNNNPRAVVVAAGCYVQSAGEKIIRQGMADILLGNNKKKEIVSILEDFFAENRADSGPAEGSGESRIISRVPDMSRRMQFEDLTIHRTDGHTRAYVKIQDGCNQFCSYCIIPYARGRIRSKKPEKVVEEIASLAVSGYKEVVLTGIHLSSYGKDLGDTDLTDIIRRVDRIPGIERIRLGSLEPRVITEEFVRKLLECRKLCPHFHLSLQSGCDETLARMNRHYTTADYEAAVNILRKYYEEPALTTDVIAGFVGETEEEFGRTEEFLKKIRLYEMHIFKYSLRQGTRAAGMSGHLPDTIKNQRSASLLKLAAQLKREYEEKCIGTLQKVLLEDETVIDGVRYMQGYTERYVRIAVKINEKDTILTQNDIVVVKVEGFLDKNLLFGEVSIEF